MTLPIDVLESTFLAQLPQSALIVSAQTGSGKSTRLPIWAAEHGKVLVVEPRRIACTSLAQFLAEQQGAPLGQEIGYAIRFETHFTPDTRIIFATPGVVLRWFFDNKLVEFTTVILDEFHERRWDTDLLLALLKQHQQHQLVVTSATLHAKKIATYLDARILSAQGRQFDVELKYMASDMRQMPSADHLSERIKHACDFALEHAQADILVFLPGKGEIQQAKQALSHLHVDLIALHSGSDRSTQLLALNKQANRRIILATNVAETSLTIAGIDCVIDTGLERRTHLRNGRTVLDMDCISADSSEQRKGRAGRTQAGLCIRLYGEFAPLIAHTPPEILRENLNELVLSAACASQGIHSLDFLEPLPQASLQRAIDDLQRLGALDAQLLATEHGKRLYPLPINSDLAHLISQMPNNSLRQAMGDVAAVIGVPKQVYQLSNSLEAIEALNQSLPNLCDVELCIALVRGQVADCLEVDSDALIEAKALAEQIRTAFDLPPLSHPASYNRDALLDAMMVHLPSAIFIAKQSGRHFTMNNAMQEVQIAKQSRVSECEAALVLDIFSLAGKGVKQARNLATCVAPFASKRLVQLNLTEQRLDHVYLEDNEIMADISHQFAGKVIQTTKQPVAPSAHTETLCQLIYQGDLLPGLLIKIDEQFQSAHLYAALNKLDPPDGCAKTFIRRSIEELGISELDEIALLDCSDFDLNFIPHWQLEEFNQLYPRQLQLAGLNLMIEYIVSNKTVMAHYHNGLRKEGPKRWELPTWSNWKIRYKKASKIIDIR
ncbi:helicase-related protein [Pseudoalteromonas ulvae]|uniref:ATP-dependent helicase n=1 Tax=Pseudoalteromonas ulvae TaxID=107327 RepID=A0A244CTH9_PSEDV|nr:helicase-related protein [Pseudoalteromonas ulvae]OUL58913.1 hypothetical protein B1199_01105 [Pseudoalteromonas ulvae]